MTTVESVLAVAAARYVGAAAGGGSPNIDSFDPGDTSALPGASTLGHLANSLGTFALIAAMVGVMIGAVMWAFGSYSQNYQQAVNGRKGVMVSALAAVLIGAAPHLINFFLGLGGQVH